MSNRPHVSTYADKNIASQELARSLVEKIKEINASGRNAVLGLATGSTPILFYQELVRLHREEGASFAKVTTFNLDEYLGLEREHPRSYWSFMQEKLFSHIDIAEENTHIPSGIVDDVEAHCREYEQAIVDAGGIDFQILGIGRTGHIGFNEPGSPSDSRTRKIELDELTRKDAAAGFGGIENVPTAAITMGVGTILAAREIALLAFGSHKAEIVKEALEGPVTAQVSASFLQDHPNAHFILDEEAAAEL